MVGIAGFEPAISRTRTERDSQASLYPEENYEVILEVCHSRML